MITRYNAQHIEAKAIRHARDVDYTHKISVLGVVAVCNLMSSSNQPSEAETLSSLNTIEKRIDETYGNDE